MQPQTLAPGISVMMDNFYLFFVKSGIPLLRERNLAVHRRILSSKVYIS